MYGFLVFSAEVDDRGIDFVARTLSGKYHDVQVKTITSYNYTYVTESKFSETLLICLVVLMEGQMPETYLFRGSDWTKRTVGFSPVITIRTRRRRSMEFIAPAGGSRS